MRHILWEGRGGGGVPPGPTNCTDSEDDYHSGCRNAGHCHQQFFSELHSPGKSVCMGHEKSEMEF